MALISFITSKGNHRCFQKLTRYQCLHLTAVRYLCSFHTARITSTVLGTASFSNFIKYKRSDGKCSKLLFSAVKYYFKFTALLLFDFVGITLRFAVRSKRLRKPCFLVNFRVFWL